MTSRSNPAVVDIHQKKQRILDQMMHLDGQIAGYDQAIALLEIQRRSAISARRDLVNQNGDASQVIGEITRLERQRET